MKNRRWRRGAALGLGVFLAFQSVQPALAPVSILNPAARAYAYTERSASVKATSLNIRSDAGTDSSVVAKLSYGTAVTVIGEKTASDGVLWYQIRFSGSGGTQQTGYASSQYIKFPVAYAADADFEAYLDAQGFPESYRAGLRELHAQYPNWVFTAQHTGIDWEEAIKNESVITRNLVSSTSISSWKSIQDGAYNWDTSSWNGFDGANWVQASEDIIRYYMDPRNFLNEKYIFQFLLQSYNASAHTAEGLESMVEGTFLESKSTENAGGLGPGESSGGPGAVTSPTDGAQTPADGPGSGTVTEVTGSQNTAADSNGGPGMEAPSGAVQAPSASEGAGSGENGTSIQAPGDSGSYIPEGNTNGPVMEAPGGGSGTTSSGISMEAPGSGNGGSGVSLVGPQASISGKKREYLAEIGPGVGLSGPVSGGTVNNSSSGPGSDTSGSGTTAASQDNGAPASGSRSYVDIIMDAGAQSGVNPYVLAAMIIQEQGTAGTSPMISGTVSGYEGIYNFFNVEAYETSSMSKVAKGLSYAAQSGSYNRPWNSVERSIIGGALNYGENYVKAGQDTFYLKKFNVQGKNMYKHQYMTNVQGAASEGAKMAEAYTDDVKQTALEFKIPVYNNMPAEASAMPTADGSPNNKLSSLEVSGFAMTPAFSKDTVSYDVIVNSSVTSVTVAASAIESHAQVSGTGTVSLNGSGAEVKVSVTAQNGTVREYLIRIAQSAGGPMASGTSEGSSQGPGGGSDTSAGPGVTAGPGAAGGPGSSGPGVTILGPGGTAAASESSMNGPGGDSVTVVN